MNFDHPSPARRSLGGRPAACFARFLLAVLLLFGATGEALAASGSTRLTIRIDQGVVDAIARWRGETPRPPRMLIVPEAERVLQRLLPVARAGLAAAHPPRETRRILQRLQRDSLLLFDGRAGHAGRGGGACVTGGAENGRQTVHSI